MLLDISTKKYPDVFAMVDDEDFERVSRFKWSGLRGTSKTVYAIRSSERDKHSGKRKTIYLHREILGATGPVDHRDMNGLNNTKHNLRVSDRSKNMANTVKISGTTSKYKGVTFSKRDAVYFSRIGFDNKITHLGNFKNEDDAAKAYDRAARNLFGTFARLNFPEVEA